MINILFYYSTVVPYICMVSVLHSSQLPCRILDKFDAIICKTQRIILSCNTTMICEWNSEQFHHEKVNRCQIPFPDILLFLMSRKQVDNDPLFDESLPPYPTVYNYICGDILFCPHIGNYHGSKPIYVSHGCIISWWWCCRRTCIEHKNGGESDSTTTIVAIYVKKWVRQ